MEWVVERKYFKDTYTIGNFYIDGKWICNTLEDKNRDLNKNGLFDDGLPKVYAQTAIPFGRYRITRQWWAKYNNYFPLLLSVPYFTGIFIHGGTTERDSAGCILVGANTIKGKLTNSSKYMKIIREYMDKAINAKDKIWITIR